MKYWFVLAAALSLALAGCDADEGQQGSDTSSVDGTAQTDTQATDTGALDTGSADTGAPDSVAVTDSSVPDTNSADGANPDASGTPCMDYTECAAGEFCSEAGFCGASQCDGVLSPSACGSQKCVPGGIDAYACVDVGAGNADDACMLDSDCSGNLLCIDGFCWAPECATDGSMACTASEECSAFQLDGFEFDFGACVQACDPFQGSTCPGGEFCSLTVRDTTSGQLTGVCAENGGGSVAVGGDCSTDTCADGLLCLSGTCADLCDPSSATSGSGACQAAGTICTTLVDGDGAPLDFGACVPGCTPYTDPDGCGADEWCMPTQTDITVGQCTPSTGTAQESELCGDGLGTCGADLFCLGFTSTESRCVRSCDPGAASTDPGGCGTNFECRGLQSNMTPVAFGFCQEVCTYNHGAMSADCSVWGSCVMGELFGATDGTCLLDVTTLNEFENCTDAGLAEFDLCGPNRLCLQIDQLAGPDVLCYDLCATAEGAFNTTNHPDCTRDMAICSQLFQSDEFGVCGAEL